MTKAFILAIATACVATSAGAQPPLVVTADAIPPPTARVSFADLNLDSAAGQERLVRRIHSAASSMCIEAGKQPLETITAQRSCFKTAVSDGIDQMQRVLAARKSGASLASTALTISGR